MKLSTEYGGKSQLNLGHLVDSDTLQHSCRRCNKRNRHLNRGSARHSSC
ncbi:hypothetical protein RZN68_13495 [Enterobacter hormaechei]|nr:hypothetical protein [Enterobacter hormaechei]